MVNRENSRISERRQQFQTEAVNFLSKPGSVLVQKEDVVWQELSRDKILNPKKAISIEIKIEPDFIDIAQASGAEVRLHLKSNLAQAGLSINSLEPSKLRPEKGNFKLTLHNVGPNEITIPADASFPIGNPYGYKKANYSEEQALIELKKIQDANKNINFEMIDGSHELGIEMSSVLMYPIGGRSIRLDENFPRGTRRDLLHNVLGIEEVELKNGESYADLCKRLGIHPQNDYYVLIQTDGPIHYPEGQGIVMTGGLIKEKGGNLEFEHGLSNLGQYRSHDPKSENLDPEHSLIGEFHYLPIDILDFMFNKKCKIFMTATPVTIKRFSLKDLTNMR